MRRILVTGGSGFVGSHVVDKLRDAGFEPRIFDRRRSLFHGRGVEFVRGDLSDQQALERAMRGCHAVVHLAAVADVADVDADPLNAAAVNAGGTAQVLAAARAAGVERIVYASTVWVYSDCLEPTVDEDTPLEPPGHFYSATKLAGELYCKAYAETHGLEYTILRFGIPYGPRAREAAVVPRFVQRAIAGEALTVAGSGQQSRSFVYVEDLAAGVMAALRPEAANRVYNLATDTTVTILEIAETVRDVVGDCLIEHTPARAQDFGGKVVSSDRAREELGWSAATPFASGVRHYVDWHREQSSPPARRRRRWATVRGVSIPRPRFGAVVLAVTAALGALSTDLPYPVVAGALHLRPMSNVSTDRSQIGLVIEAPDAATPALAAELARRNMHATFAFTDPPRPSTLATLHRLGDDAVPELRGGAPLHWVRTGGRLKQAARRLGLSGHFFYLVPTDGFTLGQYVLARRAGGSAVKGAVQLHAGSTVNDVSSGQLVRVSLPGSTGGWPRVLDSLDTQLHARGITAVGLRRLVRS